ncbi:MAG: NPCBM/NEW2 domain-containing protein [Armatimonadota bacterium]
MATASYSDTTDIKLDMQPDKLMIHSGGKSLPVSLECPIFTINDISTPGNVKPLKTSGSIGNGKGLSVDFAPIPLGDSAKLEVKLHLKWSAKEGILRKWAEYRIIGTTDTMLIMEIILETINTQGIKADFMPTEPQSYPAFLPGFFAGIEYPVASTRIDGSNLVIAHRPGIRMQPGTWYTSRTAIFGAAEEGTERRSFERYIAAHRPAPKGFHINYNSWWTSPVPYAENDILEEIHTLNEKLYKPSKTTFDSFTIDMGWSNTKTMWEIDSKRFPKGFSKIQDAAEQMKSNLGLWISPSSCYPGALDNHWAQEQGYETFGSNLWGDPNMRLACLGGKRYAAAFADRLSYMAEFNGVKQYKLDGCYLQCPETDHGHEPGLLSSEAIAEGVINALTKARKARHDIWFEPTCFGFNPSPWWLFHVNSVIGTFGDDSPYGRVPAPVYRESYTSARDYFNMQGAYHLPIPIVAQEVLGIVHQSCEPFMNDAVMTVLRGNMFISAYINPKWMDDARWKSLAGLIKWARKHASDLQETEPLLPASWKKNGCPAFTHEPPMPREPYGYAHWNKDLGLAAIRNPWITPVTFKLKIGEIAFETGTLSAVSVYPEPRIYGTDLRASSALDIPLAPYETVVLSIQPTRSAENIPSVKDSLYRKITVVIRSQDVTKVAFKDDISANPSQLSPLAGVDESVRIRQKSTVTVDAPSSELLILVEDKTAVSCPYLSIMVNGKKVEYTGSGSETGWAATGAPKPEYWLFLKAPLQSGVNEVEFELMTRKGTPKISAWVWATKPGSTSSDKGMIPQPETISLDSYNLMPEIDTSSVALSESKIERPVLTINGVFIDALELKILPTPDISKRNTGITGAPLSISGRQFSRGIASAPSRITVSLNGEYGRFQSWVGLDDGLIANYMDRSSVSFEVWGDGEKLWKSETISIGAPALFVDVDISGRKSLELVVVDCGDGRYPASDWSIWGEAKLLK